MASIMRDRKGYIPLSEDILKVYRSIREPENKELSEDVKRFIRKMILEYPYKTQKDKNAIDDELFEI